LSPNALLESTGTLFVLFSFQGSIRISILSIKNSFVNVFFILYLCDEYYFTMIVYNVNTFFENKNTRLYTGVFKG
ncbi:hypothetical protein P4U23_07655, partial [Aeribacillus composti]|uniref:hypothetical protein n=1 Tax=Aeribacillus composti TaxID=1868734 RepID=UPI002E1E8FD5|nr:hypothetical protein [Aeribacillus composti]